jgi:hypothetical protein
VIDGPTLLGPVMHNGNDAHICCVKYLRVGDVGLKIRHLVRLAVDREVSQRSIKTPLKIVEQLKSRWQSDNAESQTVCSSASSSSEVLSRYPVERSLPKKS